MGQNLPREPVVGVSEALADGADLLVIGRPITGSDDVAESARLIAASL